MKNFLYVLAFSMALVMGCQDKNRTAATSPNLVRISQEDLFARVEKLAIDLQAKADQPQDRSMAISLIKQSKNYVKQYPKDSKHNPAFLFRAGEVARSIGQYQEALALFEQVYTQYPDSKMAVKARFLEAHTYEDGLKDKKKAAQAYENLLKKHPNDPLAEQARQLLLVIDKSPEELIREFEQKNKQ